ELQVQQEATGDQRVCAEYADRARHPASGVGPGDL
ncbi:MAG: hypothetical protein AVDCRST_MAG37-3177, partial [uncultured Rubrobacteraceae bacterium]